MTEKSANKLLQQNREKDAGLDQSDSNGGEKWSDAEGNPKMELMEFANGLDVKDKTNIFWPTQLEELSLYE